MIQDPATKKDLEITKNELNKAIDEVKADLNEVKADLNEVKADLNEVKADINSVKGELQNVKNELKLDIEHLSIQVARNQVDFHEYKEENRQKLDTVLSSIDGLARLITNGQVEKAATESALRRHDNLLIDHETRIGVLEKTTV